MGTYNEAVRAVRFIATTALCLGLLFGGPGGAFGITPFRIGTGGSKGVYYPIGKLIAEGITRQGRLSGSPLEGMLGVAQNSAGSVQNVRDIVSGAIEAGLVQADIAAFAHSGTSPFNEGEQHASLRAIASLYPENFQLVVRRDASIRTFMDLRGKKISLDELGSGTLAVMRILLAAHAMDETDLSPLYLKPSYSLDLIRSKKLQGFTVMAGAPATAVTELVDAGITLVPIEPAVLSQIYQTYPYLYPGTIEADTYAGIPATTTLEVYALLLVDARLPEETAYALTAALFDPATAQLLTEGHPLGKRVTLDTAVNGISVPLHPGAERFYREHKLTQKTPR